MAPSLLYDALNCRTNKTTPDTGSVTHAYDPIHRLTHVDYPAAPALTYNYDVVGNRITAVANTTSKYTVNDLNARQTGGEPPPEPEDVDNVAEMRRDSKHRPRQLDGR